MKLFFYAILFFICFSSCSSPVDNVIKIYDEATNKAYNASTSDELRNISIEVKDKLTKEGDKFGGDSKLSNEDMSKVSSARQRYESAMESANLRINGNRGQWE